MDLVENKGEVIIYQTDDGMTHIDARMEDETVWLTQQQKLSMKELMLKSRSWDLHHLQESCRH